MFGHPIVTIRQLQARLNASDYTFAQRYVRKLEQAGILREVTGRTCNRIYRADEILRAIEGPIEEL